ncbi:MAG: hypothetical protein IH587_14335 [Anaerolineae bacterium]|nr:hypothetical protein [Anaerolineae bacterium]
MHKGFDQELDHLINAGLRNETGFSPSAMNTVRERLLANAARQAMLPAVQARTRRSISLGSIFGFVSGWIYTLIYEETCYDRARSLPERTGARQYVWMHSFDRYMFMRPAF